MKRRSTDVAESIYYKKKSQTKELFAQINAQKIQEKLIPDIEKALERIYETTNTSQEEEERIRNLCHRLEEALGKHTEERKCTFDRASFNEAGASLLKATSEMLRSEPRSYHKSDSWYNAMLISGLD